MLRFPFLGFPVTVHWMFWIMGVFLGTMSVGSDNPRGVLVVIVAFFISILIHELGHALAFRMYGGRAEIVLHGMGGFATSPGDFNRWQHLVISAAGPLFGISLYFLTRVLVGRLGSPSSPDLQIFVSSMLFMNLYWTILNLMPVIPLDGGQIFASVLGPKQWRLVAWTGVLVAGAIAAYGVMNGRMFLLILFGMMAWENFQRATGKQPSGLLGTS